MIRSAVVTSAFFAALHLGGCGRFVGVLSGTLDGGRWGLFLGLLYALSWFTLVLVVPVLLLAGLAGRLLGAGPSGALRRALALRPSRGAH